MDNKVASAPIVSDSFWKIEERREALEAARRSEIPDRKEEDWRYLNPNTFPWEEMESAASNGTPSEVTVTLESEAGAALPIIDAPELKDVLAIRNEDIDARFLYLHRALAGSTVTYRIPANLRTPLRIIQRIENKNPTTFTTVLHVESGADAIVYDRWETEANGRLPAIGRVEIILESGARLHFFHEDHLDLNTHLYRRVRAQVGEGAKLDLGIFSTGSTWHAAKMELELQGTDAESSAYGLFSGAGERMAEHRTLQHHAHPQTKSDFMFKSLLAENSRSIYQGMIRVEKNAQRTDAYQASRNLTLSPLTHAEAIPRLEILADDVRCSHGATVGTVDDDLLFYLMTRGLNRDQAVATIATGFAEEIIRRVPIEDIAQRWRRIVQQTIGNILT